MYMTNTNVPTQMYAATGVPSYSNTTIPAKIHFIVGSLSQVPAGTSRQVTANSTLALPVPPAVTSAVGNGSEIFTGGAQKKLAEVPTFIILGATFFWDSRAIMGIALRLTTFSLLAKRATICHQHILFLLRSKGQ